MTSKCAHCKKPTVEEFKPFCSKRCADVDLGKWLSGSYVIAGRDGEAQIPDGMLGEDDSY